MAYLVFLKNFQKTSTKQFSTHNYSEQEQRMEGGMRYMHIFMHIKDPPLHHEVKLIKLLIKVVD